MKKSLGTTALLVFTMALAAGCGLPGQSTSDDGKVTLTKKDCKEIRAAYVELMGKSALKNYSCTDMANDLAGFDLEGF